VGLFRPVMGQFYPYMFIVLQWIFKKWDEGVMDWIDLAQDRAGECCNEPSGAG